jgi:hypothetical protein
MTTCRDLWPNGRAPTTRPTLLQRQVVPLHFLDRPLCDRQALGGAGTDGHRREVKVQFAHPGAGTGAVRESRGRAKGDDFLVWLEGVTRAQVDTALEHAPAR